MTGEQVMEQPNIYYDIIIANPPYGRIGNEITQCIVDNLEWEVYVNLMPVNDYRRFNKDNKLYQFVDIRSMKPVINGFRDAAVTTHMALINKERFRYLSKDAFEIENYADKSLKKYFYENRKREHYAIDNAISEVNVTRAESLSPDLDFVIGVRDLEKNHRMPYSKTGIAYIWNVKKSVDAKYLYDNYKHSVKGSVKSLHLSVASFKTKKEHDNFVDFVFGNPAFMLKVIKALQSDGYVKLGKVFPKVSWERKWTVEELLREYDYTEQEIQEVMDDLKNFRYLSEDEFEIENYIDPQLKKYFYETRKRSHYAIDGFVLQPTFKQFCNSPVEKTVYIGQRDVAAGHMPYSKNCLSARYNRNEVTCEQVIAESSKSEQARGHAGAFYILAFDTAEEKTNFSNFIYSKDGFRFISKIFVAMNVDGACMLSKVFPKVDFTKPQTVQSILKDYGYTSTEIQEVMDDLKNFRYMNDE